MGTMHSIWIIYALTIICGYLVGSIPWGYIIGKTKGIDLRKVGSGNIGATNASRILGKPIGLIVLCLDILKGVVATKWLPLLIVGNSTHEWLAILSGLASVIGHNFPIWLSLRGGKGIATSTGVLLALFPHALIICAVIWAIVFAISRYVSLASITAATFLPVAIALTNGSSLMIGFGTILTVMALIRHKTNIKRLLIGCEPKFQFKSRSNHPM